MQDLPRRNRLTRRRRNPSILVGELAGQHLVLRVLADKRNISGGRLSLNRVSGILTTSRSLLGRTSACSSHTSFHVGVRTSHAWPLHPLAYRSRIGEFEGGARTGAVQT